MTSAHAARYAVLVALRTAESEALRAQELASQLPMAEWRAAHKLAKAACEAVAAEERSIIAEGFDGDLDYEFKVLGRLARRYEASSMTTREVRAALYGS